jgi:preprotein translocase subunit SecG
MKRPPVTKRKPELSGYQQYLRKTTIKLILLFVILALAIGAAFYYYQRRSMVP